MLRLAQQRSLTLNLILWFSHSHCLLQFLRWWWMEHLTQNLIRKVNRRRWIPCLAKTARVSIISCASSSLSSNKSLAAGASAPISTAEEAVTKPSGRAFSAGKTYWAQPSCLLCIMARIFMNRSLRSLSVQGSFKSFLEYFDKKFISVNNPGVSST